MKILTRYRAHRIFIPFITLVIIISSCKKALDLKPPFDVPDEIALSSGLDLEAAVNGAYQSIASDNNLGGYYKIAPEVVADHLRLYDPGRAVFFDEYNRILIDKGGAWNTSYAAINRANKILDVIQRNTLNDQFYVINRDRLKGE